jgi:hypothetical protein
MAAVCLVAATRGVCLSESHFNCPFCAYAAVRHCCGLVEPQRTNREAMRAKLRSVKITVPEGDKMAALCSDSGLQPGVHEHILRGKLNKLN